MRVTIVQYQLRQWEINGIKRDFCNEVSLAPNIDDVERTIARGNEAEDIF
jgi:hypothetical protein